MRDHPAVSDEAAELAARCRHYAMCKIDYLGTGVCASGQARHFVSYFPQGRMDLYAALARKTLPHTAALLDIADSCDLCGACDRQCHFYTGMRPTRVMRALKDYVDARRNAGETFEPPPPDELLSALSAIVGEQWASNDPAVLLPYSHDPSPMCVPAMPRAVVLPRTRDEVVAVVRLAAQRGARFMVRGNGGSTAGFVVTDGIMIDTHRMRSIAFDEDNWTVVVEAGATSFEVQREAVLRGMRINAAEPAATVCGNIICSGTFSSWANVYGVAADNVVDAEFVGPDGTVFRLNDRTSPNLTSFRHADVPSPGICTKAWVRLHPIAADEQGILIPFSKFHDALAFARELSLRRLGLAVAVLGAHYLSAFISPTQALEDRIRPALTERLGVDAMVSVVADRYGIEAIKRMGRPVIDTDLMRTVMMGLTRLTESEWVDFLADLDWQDNAFEILAREEVRPLVEILLSPSPEAIAGAAEDADMREFYESLYRRPETTDLAWLTTFRIVSARMSRRRHMVALVLFVPLGKPGVIDRITEGFAHIANRHGIAHDFGFLTPLDLGRRAILEYDYYVDQTDAVEKQRMLAALPELVPFIEGIRKEIKGVAWIKHVVSQGFARKEHFLYTPDA